MEVVLLVCLHRSIGLHQFPAHESPSMLRHTGGCSNNAAGEMTLRLEDPMLSYDGPDRM